MEKTLAPARHCTVADCSRCQCTADNRHKIMFMARTFQIPESNHMDMYYHPTVNKSIPGLRICMYDRAFLYYIQQIINLYTHIESSL